jgi:hypothetical protein
VALAGDAVAATTSLLGSVEADVNERRHPAAIMRGDSYRGRRSRPLHASPVGEAIVPLRPARALQTGGSALVGGRRLANAQAAPPIEILECCETKGDR